MSPHVVIGVIGPEFDIAEFGQEPELWIPFQIDPNTVDQGHFFQAAARVKPGVTLEQAQARLKLSADEYRVKFPDALQANNSFSVEPLQQVFVRNARPTLLDPERRGRVRAAHRLRQRREPAARARHCAQARSRAARGYWRRTRTDHPSAPDRERCSCRSPAAPSASCSASSGSARCSRSTRLDCPGSAKRARSSASIGACSRLRPRSRSGPDVLFGLIPALQSSRTDLNATLKASTAQSGAVFRHNKARSILVVVEVALALLLLVGSALLIRTLVALRNVEPGFDASNVLTMRMSLAGPKYLQTAGVDQLLRDGVERLASASRRRARHCDLLRAARGWLWPAIQDRGTAAREETLPRRRRMAHCLVRILRRLQDPDQTRPGIHRSR